MKSDNDAAIRRVPQQERSRQKVTTILETAMALFQESGMDSVSMREIARACRMPIATVYQYFPNKQAIVQQIWEGHTADAETLLANELASLQTEPTKASARRVIHRIVDSNVSAHESNPAFMEIRRCVDATPDLRQLNLESTLRDADLIRQMIVSINPQVDEAQVANYALIITQATSSTVRLGQQLPEAQREKLYASLKSFLLQTIESMSG
jgi:AcrR family transcriptional regulator